MKRVIKSSVNRFNNIHASDDISDTLKDKLGTIKDDFDYLMSGIEKLGRSGANMSKEAEIIAENLASDIQDSINEVAARIQE